ncbi:MAG: hypothetical protein ACREA7_09720 [Nitrosotalea sp.]
MTHEPNNQSETRMMRGMAITETSTIRENEDGSFAVPSQTGKNIVYIVRIIENKFVCDCPDYTYRHIETCKHGYALKFWIATNTFLQNKEKPKVFAEDQSNVINAVLSELYAMARTQKNRFSSARTVCTSSESQALSKSQSMIPN